MLDSAGFSLLKCNLSRYDGNSQKPLLVPKLMIKVHFVERQIPVQDDSVRLKLRSVWFLTAECRKSEWES